MKRTLGFLLATLLVGAGAAQAAPLMRGAPAVIFPKMHLLNQSEIPAGKLGAIKACRADVRQYGMHLATDHFQADRALTLQARRFATPLSNPRLELWETQNLRIQRIKLHQLQLMHGCQFDRQFLIAMRDAHSFAIRMVSLAIADRNSQMIRPFLTNTLHALELHYIQAVQLLNRHEPVN